MRRVRGAAGRWWRYCGGGGAARSLAVVGAPAHGRRPAVDRRRVGHGHRSAGHRAGGRGGEAYKEPGAALGDAVQNPRARSRRPFGGHFLPRIVGMFAFGEETILTRSILRRYLPGVDQLRPQLGPTLASPGLDRRTQRATHHLVTRGGGTDDFGETIIDQLSVLSCESQRRLPRLCGIPTGPCCLQFGVSLSDFFVEYAAPLSTLPAAPFQGAVEGLAAVRLLSRPVAGAAGGGVIASFPRAVSPQATLEIRLVVDDRLMAAGALARRHIPSHSSRSSSHEAQQRAQLRCHSQLGRSDISARDDPAWRSQHVAGRRMLLGGGVHNGTLLCRDGRMHPLNAVMS